MKSLIFTMFASSLVITCACACTHVSEHTASPKELESESKSPTTSDQVAWVLDFANEDVQWTRDAAGIHPILNGQLDNFISSLSSNQRMASIHSLLPFLDDPRRFVLAHVLLTYFYGENIPLNDTSWNGLNFDVDSNLGPHPAAGSMKKLKALWFLQTKNLSV